MTHVQDQLVYHSFGVDRIEINMKLMQENNLRHSQMILLNSKFICSVTCSNQNYESGGGGGAAAIGYCSLDPLAMRRYRLSSDTPIQLSPMIHTKEELVSNLQLSLRRIDEKPRNLTWSEQMLVESYFRNYTFILGSSHCLSLFGKRVLVTPIRVALLLDKTIHEVENLNIDDNNQTTFSNQSANCSAVLNTSGIIENNFSSTCNDSFSSSFVNIDSGTSSFIHARNKLPTHSQHSVRLNNVTFIKENELAATMMVNHVYQTTTSSKIQIICEKTLLTTTTTIQEKFNNILIGLNNEYDLIKQRIFDFVRIDGNEGASLCLYGPLGGGKRSLMQNIFDDLYSQFDFIRVAAVEQLNSQMVNFIESSAPCVVILDWELSSISNEENSGGNQLSSSTSSSTRLYSVFKELQKCLIHSPIFLLMFTTDVRSLDKSLRTLISETLLVPLPSPSCRIELMKHLLTKVYYPHACSSTDQLSIGPHLTAFARRMPGYTAGDIRKVLSLAKVRSSSPNDLTVSAMEYALGQCVPPHVMDAVTDFTSVRWNDIIGYDEVKNQIRNILHFLLRSSNSSIGKHSNGILLYGPPGCSKTMFVGAIATEFNLNLVTITPAELYHRYVGDSEKKMREVLLHAEACAPSILFIDEIDRVLPGNKDDSSDVGSRIHTEIMLHLDGIKRNRSVILIGSTNRPDHLDQALMRSGRMGHHIYVPLPDVDTKCHILCHQLRPKEINQIGQVALKQLVEEKMIGFSGSSVVQVVDNARIAKATHLLSMDDESEVDVDLMDLSRAAQQVKPTRAADLLLHEQFANMIIE